MRAKKGHEYAGHTELKKNKQEKGLQCSGREEQQCRAGKGSDEGPKLIEWGGEGEREREKETQPRHSVRQKKQTGRWFVHPHQQTPAATVDRDGKRNLVPGEKKKKMEVVTLG